MSAHLEWISLLFELIPCMLRLLDKDHNELHTPHIKQSKWWSLP